MKFLMLHCFAFLIFGGAIATFTIPRPPIVRIPEYKVFGFTNTTSKGTKANIYLGLPYVNKPKRFEKAVPLSPNLLKSIDAKKWAKACHQVIDVGNLFETDEDCLFLNIFTPANVHLKPLPVLVFIHGGGYAYGYAQAYGFEYLVDNFIPQDVIVVTIQYRIAHFGFLATRDHVINGNFGLFDQLAALKFIKKNIIAFGGDPNRITLGGHSAGSTSTHALSFRPDTHDLFKQEIHLAGSNYAIWGIASESNYNHSELISSAVGCPQTDSHAKKACLKAVDYHRFWEVRQELHLFDIVPDKIDSLYWSPNFDQDFFQGKNLKQLQAGAPKRRILYGVEMGEMLHETLITENPFTSVYGIARSGFAYANRSLATAEKSRELILEMLVDPKFNASTKEVIINRIFDYYQVGMGPNATDPNHYFYKYTEILNVILKTAMGTEMEAKYDLGWRDQYMYILNYVRPQDRNLIGNIPGHGYILLYLCGLNIYTTNGISNTTEDNLVQNNIIQVYTSFIKGQTPSSNGVSIPKVTANSIPYLVISTDISTGTTNIKPTVDFWKQLAVDYQYDFNQQLNL